MTSIPNTSQKSKVTVLSLRARLDLPNTSTILRQLTVMQNRCPQQNLMVSVSDPSNKKHATPDGLRHFKAFFILFPCPYEDPPRCPGCPRWRPQGPADRPSTSRSQLQSRGPRAPTRQAPRARSAARGLEGNR